MYLVRGGRAEFGVRTSRKEGFDQPIILAAENLPAGVFIESIEMVDAGRKARLTLRADPQAQPARVSNLTIIGKGAAPQSFSTAAPKITLQLD